MAVQWFGPAVTKQMMGNLDSIMIKMGGALANHLRQLAPVDTGLLKSEIQDSYNKSTQTLTVVLGPHYSLFQEYGTYKMKPHPYIRPSLMAVIPQYLPGAKVDLIFPTYLKVGHIPHQIKPHIKPHIAAAQYRYSRGIVSRSSVTLVHLKRKPWQRHRTNLSKIHKLRTAWN